MFRRTTMRNILHLILLLSVFSCNNQKSTIKIDPESFLVGTLDDYMGRSKFSKIEDRVDEYYKYELDLTLKIDSLFRSNYPDFGITFSKDTNRIEIYSAQLSQKMNSYYSFKPAGSMTMEGDSVYYGILSVDRFETDEQKLSFLTGVYVRFGVDTSFISSDLKPANDSTFCIRIGNSVSKAKTCVALLTEMKCQVNYKILQNIPRIHQVYFTPTQELKNYLKEMMYLRRKLGDRFEETLKEIIGEEDYYKYTH